MQIEPEELLFYYEYPMLTTFVLVSNIHKSTSYFYSSQSSHRCS